jgi:guanidinopropionase
MDPARVISEEEMNEYSASYRWWHGIPTFLRAPHKPKMDETDIGLIGFAYSGGNPIERMQHHGPRAVRNRSCSYQRCSRFFGLNPFETLRISDLGDVPLPNILNPDLSAKDAEKFYRKVHEKGIIPITVGGDHSITTPILRAIAGKNSKHKGPIGMIHFDAHADSWGPCGGTAEHAGAAFFIGAEEGLIDPARTIQIGFHGSMATMEQEDWSKSKYTVTTMADIEEKGIDWLAKEVHRVIGSGPTYLSFDLDVLDIAFAPAVADPEVNGMTTRELFSLLNKLRGLDIVGADIACLCPPLDGPAQITSLLVSELMVHFVSHIADYRTSNKKVAVGAASKG